jgi:hypothetical protein
MSIQPLSLPHYRKLQTLKLSITGRRLIYIEVNSILVNGEEHPRSLAAETGNKEDCGSRTFAQKELVCYSQKF